MSLNISGLTGVVSWAPNDTPKRGITAAEIGTAHQRRAAGQGWQTIANILGLNVLDLRIACKDPALDPSFRPAEPAPATRSSQAKPPRRANDGCQIATLGAIADGAATGADIFRRTHLDHSSIYGAVAEARRAGRLGGSGRERTLHLTDAGRAWLEARRA